jgi:hypothetical protein
MFKTMAGEIVDGATNQLKVRTFCISERLGPTVELTVRLPWLCAPGQSGTWPTHTPASSRSTITAPNVLTPVTFGY